MDKMINCHGIRSSLASLAAAKVTRRTRLGIIANEDANWIKGKIRRRTKQ